MSKLFVIAFTTIVLSSCNGAADNNADSSANTLDSVTNAAPTDDTRGAKGTGIDNSGGTPGAGTITDTVHGRPDTLNKTSATPGSEKRQ